MVPSGLQVVPRWFPSDPQVPTLGNPSVVLGSHQVVPGGAQVVLGGPGWLPGDPSIVLSWSQIVRMWSIRWSLVGLQVVPRGSLIGL